MRKRRGLFVFIFCFVLVGNIMSVFASDEAYISHPDIHCKLYGFIQFVEGPLTISDKIWYRGQLSGEDVSLIAPGATAKDDIVYITPGTDKKTLESIRLFWGKEKVAGSKVSCGYGGTKGKLKMRYH